MIIKVGGIDPSLRNLGLAKGSFDMESGALLMEGLFLQQTDSEAGKTVRKSSDDLRCASSLVKATHEWVADCGAVFAEIPSGAQSARAAFTLGVALGVLSSVGVVGPFKGRLIQVNAADVKRHATGSKNASKHEVIEWAMSLWPDLPWPVKTRNPGKGEVDERRAEHLADACAVIYAGTHTDEFKNLAQLLRAMNAQNQSQV